MGPINFIKRVLGLRSDQGCDSLGIFDDVLKEVFHPNDSSGKFHFKWSKALSYEIKYACLLYPGLEQELKLLQCVNPLPENRCNDHQTMGCQFYWMTKSIRDGNSDIYIDYGVFAEYNIDNLPLSHLPQSIAYFKLSHNNRVRSKIRGKEYLAYMRNIQRNIENTPARSIALN